MKKIFLLFAAMCFSIGSMFAAELSYTITFKEASGDSDSSSKVTAMSDIIASGAEYVSAIPTADNIYNARIGRGLKFGASSKTGQLVLTLAQAVKPTRIVVSAMWYKDSETTLKVNGKTFITTGDFKDHTVTYDGATEVTSIDISTSSKRSYVKSVTVYYEGTVAAVEKPVITPASYEGFDAQEVTITCGTADAKIYYTLDGTEPSATSTEYTAPFTVNAAATVKAIAIKGSDLSAVATANLTILKKIANTQEAPYTVAEANALAKNTDAASLKHADNKVYIKGIVTEIKEVSTQYGNATYTIADETGATETLSVYRGKYLNDTKFDDTNKDELTVGKEVIVYGNLTTYQDAPQVAQYNWLVSITTPVATPEIKITSEVKTGTDELGDPYKYIDFGTIEYGQTDSLILSFEAVGLPAKAISYPDGITPEESDNFVTFRLDTYPFFEVTNIVGGAVEVTEDWMGNPQESYTFPIAADGTAKGSVTLAVKKDFGVDPFDEVNGYALPADSSIAVGSVVFMDQTYQNYSDMLAVMIELTKPEVVAEIKITSEVKTGTDELGDPYKYIDFGTIEYGQTDSLILSFEAVGLPAKAISYPDGITPEESDNFVTFRLDTYPFFEVTNIVGGAVEVTEDWMGNPQESYTFPIAADGTAKGSVTLAVKKDFGVDPFDEVNGYALPADSSIAVGSVVFMDQTYQNYSDMLAVMIELTKPEVVATPEIKITSELKTDTDEEGNPLSYVDFGTVEYGQTATVAISFEAKNLPAKAISYDMETGEQSEVDNYVSCILMNADMFFEVTLSEGGKTETGFMGTMYTFPIAEDGSAKGTVTLTLKSEFEMDPFDEMELVEGELTALDMFMVMDQTYQNKSEMIYVAATLTKPATALENATVDTDKAYKVIENGVVYIIKNGVKYTLLGTVVK